MTDTAIPIDHSVGDFASFINPPQDSLYQDKAITELANNPGWQILERDLLIDIERLKNTTKIDYETMEEYGLRMYSAQLCRERLEWIINHVRSTANTVTERS
jgi:hypothetical protein